MKRGLIGLALASLLLAGCGYSMESSLAPRYKTIAVNAFQNRSQEYDLTGPLTHAVRRKFLSGGRLTLAAAPEADLLLEGAVLRYELRGLTYDEEDDVTQYLLLVIGAARVTDQQTGDVLWQDQQLVGETTFYSRAAGQSSDRLRGNAEYFLPTVRSFATEEENRGASEALEQLASDIFYRTIEPW